MPVTITIDVFSGRPNPSVVVEGPEERELLQRLRPTREAKRKEIAPFDESALGYRGIIIHATGRRPRGVPAELRVVSGIGLGLEGAFGIEDEGLEDFVCGSTGPFRLSSGTSPTCRASSCASGGASSSSGRSGSRRRRSPGR